MAKELIRLVDCTMAFDGETVLDSINLYINNKEFLTLLGPSGCGKTTTLRIIGGFLKPTSGDVLFDGVRINDIPPYKRQVNTVFQKYALFPHLDVYDNIAFGLRNHKVPEDEIDERVTEMLEVVSLKGFENRKVTSLSGGQQQRVALARAIVIEPEVLLMDEPLSNLDAKLRVEMRTVIKEIQNTVGITTVYVTHDQEEAMAVSDQIAVMNHGVIQQIGTPKLLYQRPRNLFVATFIGQTNVLERYITVHNNEKCIDFGGLLLPMSNLVDSVRAKQKVRVSVRPEEFVIVGADQPGIDATVEYSTFLGLNTHYVIRLKSGERVEIIQESKIDDIIENGTKIRLGVKAEKINVFNEDGTKSLIV